MIGMNLPRLSRIILNLKVLNSDHICRVSLDMYHNTFIVFGNLVVDVFVDHYSAYQSQWEFVS